LISLVIAMLISLWCTMVYGLTAKTRAKQVNDHEAAAGLSRSIKDNFKGHVQKVSEEAKAFGIPWRIGDTLFLWAASFVLSGFLFFLTKNALLFIAGWIFMGLLPSMLIKVKYQRQRLLLLEGLVDCLRQIIARLPDQGNFVRALELTVQGQLEPGIAVMLQEVIKDVSLGCSMEAALKHWRQSVRLRKFNHVVDTILQAHYEGWTKVAMDSMDKAVQAMEADLQAIKLAQQKSRSRKRQLYLTILTAWSFPLILSFLNSGGNNIYLCTLPGKVLVFAYVVGTFFVIVKGQEYLSLNVDEL
jgi:Flp pilus assembly protein TadB